MDDAIDLREKSYDRTGMTCVNKYKKKNSLTAEEQVGTSA